MNFEKMAKEELTPWEIYNLKRDLDQGSNGFGGDADVIPIQCCTLSTLLKFYLDHQKDSRVIESMTKYETQDFIVRVWREELEALDGYDNSDIEVALIRLAQSQSKKEVAEKIAEMDRVNAVEVLSKYLGNGLLIYPEWP